MADELYFIPIIARALQARDPRKALREAFETIRELGKRSDHETGYRQFLAFMAEAMRSSQAGALADKWPDDVKIESGFDFVVERDGEVLGTIPFASPAGKGTLSAICPGHYVLSVQGSRVIWEADLRPEDVDWRIAFPGRDLPAAAETETVRSDPTREEPLLSGEVILRVYPGLRGGILEIEIRSKEGA